MALVDALGNLVRFVLLPGNRYDTVGVENDSLSDFYLSGIAGGQIIPKMKRFRSTFQHC